MRAVDAIMECLKAEGVEHVFGIPGGANLPTYDAFYDAGIRHILVRHEAGGGHAAEGYAKATGNVGVSIGTSGPGATNLVTPICDAMMDSVPVVFLTGQVRTELLGTDGFQEADTIGITMPIVKHSFMIQHPLELPRSIHEAFHIARTGRPGPVVVDIRVTLLDGKSHSVDSSDYAFQMAGSLALREAAAATRVTLLEPIDEISVLVPDDFVGAVMGDLSSRRGRVLGTDTAGQERTVVKAEVPQVELTRYAIDLRSLAHGAASFTRSFARYEPMPESAAARMKTTV